MPSTLILLLAPVGFRQPSSASANETCAGFVDIRRAPRGWGEGVETRDAHCRYNRIYRRSLSYFHLAASVSFRRPHQFQPSIDVGCVLAYSMGM